MTGRTDPSLWVTLGLCAAATYGWRGLGVALSGRIDPGGAVFRWVACVAYAMLAGLIARMLLLPVGSLAGTTLLDRGLAVAAALTVFFLARRSMLAGLVGGCLAIAALSAMAPA